MTLGSQDTLEEKTVTVCFGADFVNVSFINFCATRKEIAQVSSIYVYEKKSMEKASIWLSFINDIWDFSTQTMEKKLHPELHHNILKVWKYVPVYNEFFIILMNLKEITSTKVSWETFEWTFDSY